MAVFQNRLRELRKSLGLSQEELGQKFNLAKSTISQYELGKRSPDSVILTKLADFFNVTVDYLLGRTDVKIFYNDQTSMAKKYLFEAKICYNLATSELPEEAIKQIDDYIEFIKQKYHSKEPFQQKE